MGTGPWVRPPDQVVPVTVAILSRGRWFAGTSSGVEAGFTNPGGWTWEQIVEPDPGLVEPLVAFTTEFTYLDAEAFTGRRPATTPGFTLLRGLFRAAMSAGYPQIAPDHIPDGATVEYEDDGEYLANPTLLISATLTTGADNTSDTSGPTAVVGQIKHLSTYDGVTSLSLADQPPGATVAAAPTLGSGSALIGSNADFTASISTPFDAPVALAPWLSWEASGIPTPDAPGPDQTSSLEAAVTVLDMAATCLYRPPHYRLITEASGSWRLRQRQTLPGSDSWPLRQRQNGASSGSWPSRQRQRGM